MTYALLVVTLAILVAAALERRFEQRAFIAALRLLNAAHERERVEWTRERQLLLNRIKPETAQYVATDEPVRLTPTGVFDDDDAYWAAAGNVTKEQLADALMRHETGGNGEPA